MRDEGAVTARKQGVFEGAIARTNEYVNRLDTLIERLGGLACRVGVGGEAPLAPPGNRGAERVRVEGAARELSDAQDALESRVNRLQEVVGELETL